VKTTTIGHFGGMADIAAWQGVSSGDGQDPVMPSDVTSEEDFFDNFASRAGRVASRAPFFAGCVALIVIWAPTVAFLS
jgi:hypothetical protein